MSVTRYKVCQLAALVLSSALLPACGNKGDLYLDTEIDVALDTGLPAVPGGLVPGDNTPQTTTPTAEDLLDELEAEESRQERDDDSEKIESDKTVNSK